VVLIKRNGGGLVNWTGYSLNVIILQFFDYKDCVRHVYNRTILKITF